MSSRRLARDIGDAPLGPCRRKVSESPCPARWTISNVLSSRARLSASGVAAFGWVTSSASRYLARSTASSIARSSSLTLRTSSPLGVAPTNRIRTLPIMEPSSFASPFVPWSSCRVDSSTSRHASRTASINAASLNECVGLPAYVAAVPICMAVPEATEGLVSQFPFGRGDANKALILLCLRLADAVREIKPDVAETLRMMKRSSLPRDSPSLYGSVRHNARISELGGLPV
jgi:hypothetical protein